MIFQNKKRAGVVSSLLFLAALWGYSKTQEQNEKMEVYAEEIPTVFPGGHLLYFQDIEKIERKMSSENTSDKEEVPPSETVSQNIEKGREKEGEALSTMEASEDTEEEQEEPAEEAEMEGSSSPFLYSISRFRLLGVVYWEGFKFTYYSETVLPGGGLSIPGRHVNEDGFIADEDGYIVLANDAPKGTVIDTPFGYQGKVYDRGTYGNHFDVYIH